MLLNVHRTTVVNKRKLHLFVVDGKRLGKYLLGIHTKIPEFPSQIPCPDNLRGTSWKRSRTWTTGALLHLLNLAFELFPGVFLFLLFSILVACEAFYLSILLFEQPERNMGQKYPQAFQKFYIVMCF